MDKKKRIISIIIFAIVIFGLLVISFLTRGLYEGEESIQEMMKDAVVHETGHVQILPGLEVNPGLVSAFIVSGILILFALIVRVFVIPKFKVIPGKFQSILEMLVGLFTNMAKENSHHRNKLLGGYLFVAACYIFTGTCFELFGFQVVTTHGLSVALPAPLADINGAICLGCLSYLFIMSGGITENGLKGVGKTLKEFSLPISMSFRLFGALLSGALVTELVYYYTLTSYVVPAAVGVIFTLLHAVIQSYVLTTLVSIFYGEVTEHEEKKPKKVKGKAKSEKALEA